MEYEKNPSGILIVSSGERAIQAISELLRTDADINRPLTVAESGGEARRLMLSETFETVIINSPLKDEQGTELAVDIASALPSSVILLTDAGGYEEICSEVGDCGVLCVPKPVGRNLFHQTLKLAEAVYSKVRKYDEERVRAMKKLEEYRIMSRAKCVLMEKNNFCENDAHHYIEKTAMDTRMTIREVCENILRIYL